MGAFDGYRTTIDWATPRKNPDKFWVVYNPKSRLPITVRFDEKQKALDVADKMAQQYGERFYVMEGVGYAEPVKNTRTVMF